MKTNYMQVIAIASRDYVLWTLQILQLHKHSSYIVHSSLSIVRGGHLNKSSFPNMLKTVMLKFL